MVADLQDHQSFLERQGPVPTATLSPSSDPHDDLRIVLVGTDQCHALIPGLRRALPRARIHACPSVDQATPADVAVLHSRLVSADVLILQDLEPEEGNRIGLDGQTLLKWLPAGGVLHRVPTCLYEGHHPWIGQVEDLGAAGDQREQSPLGDDHDFLAMVAAARGIGLETLLSPSLPEDLKRLLQEVHRTSLEAWNQREADCDVRIADWIGSEYRRSPLVHTCHQPAQALLKALLDRLLARIGTSDDRNPPQTDQQEPRASLSLPIHPWVGAALGLEDWHRGWGQKAGSPFGIHEQLQASLAFYQRHPWILEVHASHPKAELAGQVLSLVRGAPMGVGNPLSSQEPESLRRPIPYAFLDPRDGFTGGVDDPSTPGRSLDWDLPLQTYRLGWRSEQQALLLPVGVVTAQGWLCDCLQYLPPEWQQADWMRSVGGYQLSSLGDTLHLIPPETRDEHVLAGRWCVLNDIVAHRNLGHFFHDLLPQLMAIRRLQQRWPDLQILGSVERQPNLRLLRELVLDRGWQPRPPSRCHRVEELILQPLAFNGGIGFLGQPDRHWWLAIDDLRDGLELLRRKLAPDPASLWRGHWLCFSRDLHAITEAPQGRVFSNYPQLIERLSNAGVVIVDPGHFDIRQLQLLVAGARGFVGIHGAGMFNALLGNPGARVVEIRPACGVWRTVELTSLVAGLDWRPIACASDPDDPQRSVIPIDSVMDLIA